MLANGLVLRSSPTWLIVCWKCPKIRICTIRPTFTLCPCLTSTVNMKRPATASHFHDFFVDGAQVMNIHTPRIACGVRHVPAVRHVAKERIWIATLAIDGEVKAKAVTLAVKFTRENRPCLNPNRRLLAISSAAESTRSRYVPWCTSESHQFSISG